MSRKSKFFVVFTLILLLFMPLVALALHQDGAESSVRCLEADTAAIMQGADEPGKRPLIVLPAAPLDLNLADAYELMLLPGIGQAHAGDILELRRRLGRFESTEDILTYGCVGEQLYERVLPFITVEGPDITGDSL